MFDKVNIRRRYSETIRRISDFLLSDRSREFLIFLFFVFVSFSFWLLQVLDETYETELSIPVRMKNVPENVVMTSELPREMRVGVQDRGTVLVNYMLGQTFYPVTLDFSEYAGKGNQVRIHSSELMKRISAQLNTSTKVLTVKPDILEFIYTQGKGKMVPVKVQGEVRTARQYYVSGITCSPDSVMVYAPRAILDTLTGAYTRPLEVEEVSDTLRRRLDIVPVKGARFTPAYSDIAVMVDIYAEKTVEVPVRGVGFPADKVLRTFPSKVKLTFQVGLSHFKEITADDFVVEVSYNELADFGEEKCRPSFATLSPYVNHVRMNPREIDYIIEQQSVTND
ncbi:MAG: YbbR-like domain-containing protein [Bacteroides sp.]|nr:YbbR-like domain-containing protein [Bacteroides sp.]